MAQRKRASDAEIRKNRQAFLLLECQRGIHQWNNSTSSQCRFCPVCKSVEKNNQVYPGTMLVKSPAKSINKDKRAANKEKLQNMYERVEERGLHDYWR